MPKSKLFILVAAALVLWLGSKYLLPFFLPFLLGGLVALSAEPLVQLGTRRLHLSRGTAAALAVTVTLVLLAGLISLLGAILIRELGQLANALPDLESTAENSMSVLENWLLDLAARTPESMVPVLTRTVHHTFDGGTVLMEQVADRVPEALGKLLSWVPDGLLGLGTGLLAAFMISVRLPKLRKGLWDRIPEETQKKLHTTGLRAKRAVGGWLRAQGKLMLITYGIVALGFLLLRIPYGLLWAALIALVDAVPMLGTGIVLLPWALASFLQGNTLQALVLVAIFIAALLARSVLEPKLVGKQLGLDPLLALICIYAGYRLWGFLGLVIAPMAASVIKSVMDTKV